MKFVKSIVAVIVCAFLPIAQAELSFSVQPNILNKDPSVYQRIAKQLENIVGEPVTYKQAKNLNVFSKELWRNKYDIVLMEPHVGAWFLKAGDNGGTEHDLLLASDAQVRFTVLTPEEKPYYSIEDLNGKYVCSPPSPSLAAVAFLNQVDNPVNPPSIFNIKNNEHAFKSIQKKRCDAIVVESRDEDFWRQQPIAKFKTLYSSGSFPGWVMTIYAIHPPQIKDALVAAFKSPELSNTAIGDFFKSIEQASDIKFVDTPQDEAYLQYNILPGVVWGW